MTTPSGRRKKDGVITGHEANGNQRMLPGRMASLEIASGCMYAVVSSAVTCEKWKKPIDDLFSKYDKAWPGRVKIVQHDGDLSGALPELQKLRPSFCCFVAMHTECSSDFVRSVHMLTRRIDPTNAYTDTVWGILTGGCEDDVLFSICQKSPLVVRRVMGGTVVNLSKCESGLWYSEGEQSVVFKKRRGCSDVLKEECPPDATEELAMELCKSRSIEHDEGVDMMVTSGHATESDWNIGYSFKSGQFVPRNGLLYGLTLDNRFIPIANNGSPKIYSAAGNCLMGHIDGDNCMALAWMHSAGIVQMTGYIVPTWFGYAGWGVHKYFFNNPGTMNFSEAFFANQQSLLAKLETEYPDALDEEQFTGVNRSSECMGLLHDQDKVAFYGDPAYDARLLHAESEVDYTTTLSQLNADTLPPRWTKWEIKITTRCHGQFNCPTPDDKLTSFGRPPVYVFPCTMKEVRVLEGKAIINCRFILLPLFGKYKPGQIHRAVFALLP